MPACRLTIIILAAAIAAAALSVSSSANATALYWTKTPVKTASVKSCLSFAASAMRDLSMQNIRVSAMEVAGSRGGVYAAITCFNTAPRATAIAMGAGDNLAATRQLSEDLQRKIAGIQMFD